MIPANCPERTVIPRHESMIALALLYSMQLQRIVQINDERLLAALFQLVGPSISLTTGFATDETSLAVLDPLDLMRPAVPHGDVAERK